MNEESARMRVNLVFWTHPSAWEVIRGITRLPNGAVVSSCILNRVGEDARVRGVRRVNHRLGELLERDSGSAGYPPRAAIRCPSPRQSPHDGAAHGEAATTGDEIALLWECLAAVGRESDAVRREAARVADATAAAELARARHQQSRAALVEFAEALRHAMARKAAAIERLREVGARYGRGAGAARSHELRAAHPESSRRNIAVALSSFP